MTVRSLAAATAGLLLLVGCASIPTDSPVIAGGPSAPDRAVREVVAGPAAGAQPLQVVNGFIGASPGAPDEYGVARSYLTSRRGESWSPEDSTVVFSGAAPTVSGPVASVSGVGGSEPVPADEQGPITGQITVPVVATVDADGRYVPAVPGEVQTYDVVLVKQAGQWRIDEVPDLVLVSEADFTFQYRSYPLWFLDPTGEVLVPESRWLPSTGAPTATRLVSELLQGPSSWLAGAVTTAVPQGTSLAPPRSVTNEDGTTVIELTDQVRRADGPQRVQLRAQLLATLQPLLGTTDVELRVDGGALDVPGGGAVPAPADESVGDPVLVDETSLLRLSGDRLIPIDNLGPIEGLGATDPAVSSSATRFAVLTSDRSELRVLELGTTDQPEVAATGVDLTAPSIDRRGWVWSTSAASEGVVAVVSPDGVASPDGGVSGVATDVEAGWLAGRRVTSLRVSRDGARVVVVSTDSVGVASVDLAGVERADDGTPLRLSQAPSRSVAPQLVSATVAAWTDADEVAVLGAEAAGDAPRVHLVAIGGPRRPARAPVEGVTGMTAGTGSRSVLVTQADGSVLTPSGSTWRVLVPPGPAVDPAYPG